MAEVREKCKRCKMRASEDGGYCRRCGDELVNMTLVREFFSFDHYFWGIVASRDDGIYYIRIYHDCDDLEWLKGKAVKVDLEDSSVATGTVIKAESMQSPPYERGDVVAVTLKEN